MAFIQTFNNLALGSTVRGIINNLAGRANSTGWAEYYDTAYPDENDQFALSADTDTTIPNDGLGVEDGELPDGVTAFYNPSTSKIEGLTEDDFVLLTLALNVTPSSVNTTLIETWLDVGGTELYRRPTGFPKGTGVERSVVSTTGIHVGPDWATNGAIPKFRANGTADIHGVKYQICRVHAVRT